jgi:hypothetical protein
MVNIVAKCSPRLRFVGQISSEALFDAIHQTFGQRFMVYGLSHDLAQFSMELKCLLAINATTKMGRQVFEFSGGEFTIEKSFKILKGLVAIGHSARVRFR